MRIKSGPVDLDLVSQVLYGDGLKSFFGEKLPERFQNQISGACDPGVFLFGNRRYFRSCVAYPTIPDI